MSKSATSGTLQRGERIPRLRWQWDFGPALGEVDATRLMALLVALLDSSALGQAAKTAGMSYRAAWGLLRRAEEELGLPLVLMERGRGTRLTPLAERVVEMDAAARLALDADHARWEARMQALIAPALRAGGVGGARGDQFRIFASHDLALADWLEHGRTRLDLAWRGSEEALAALARGECEAAGFHVPSSWTGPQFEIWLGRWLEPRLHVCAPLMLRRQGLLVRRGNPLRLLSMADVARLGARMVNRQRGSGTRSLIDQLLAANGLRPEDIDGYAHEEFTHEAVAATVASGQADAGFGIEAAAARYDLDFVPLAEDRYGFAMRATALAGDGARTLVARLSGNTFRQRLLAMPGYTPLAALSFGAWPAFTA